MWKKQDKCEKHLQSYIDYQALSRDMGIEGNFLVTNSDIFELIK